MIQIRRSTRPYIAYFVRGSWQNRRGGQRVTSPASTPLRFLRPGRSALAMMLDHPQHDQPQARGVLFDASPTIPAPPERHFFVPDASGFYCLACNLPRGNRRHAERAA